MKKIFFLILFSAALQIQAQVWDNPIGTTTHYNLRKYAQSAHVPNTVLNNDKDTIDSVLFSLIAAIDSLQFVLVSDTSLSHLHLILKVSNYASGTRTFVTTSQLDSVSMPVTVSDTTDIFLLTAYGASITSNDVLSYTLVGTKLFVHRPASGTSGLKYVWRWIRRY